MASPQHTKMIDLGDAVLEASNRLRHQPIPVTPALCQSMCQILLAGFNHSFVVNPETLWTYFSVRLKQPRADQVAQATTLLLSCEPFMKHAVETDPRIRPVLVAGAMLHAPEKDAYRFIVDNFDPPTQVIYEASQFALDPVMLKNAEGTSVAILQKVVSFLKTGQGRGWPDTLGWVKRDLNTLGKGLGMVLVDHIKGQSGLTIAYEPAGKPKKGTTGLTHGEKSMEVGKK